jgi:hypothetical protein
LIFLAFFFFPIAVYFLILGGLNRRPHPVLVRGEWDCLGVLLASSGLILFGGPALLSAFYHAEVRNFLLGKLRPILPDFGTLFQRWWLIWLCYYFVVLAASAVLVRWRRSFTAVYNVEPAFLDEIVAQILDRIGVEWTRMGNRIFIGFRETGNRSSAARAENSSAPPVAHTTAVRPLSTDAASQPEPSRRNQTAVLDLEPFTATRHVTIAWRNASPLLRAELEAELARELEMNVAPDNPAALWFMGLASLLFILIFLCVAAMLVLEIIVRRGG